MRLWPWLIAACALTVVAGAQVPRTENEFRATMEREFERSMKVRRVLERAEELRPRRRDTPLRELNLSDNEVRAIQQEIRDVVPPEYMNISPVVSGCACEEGTECSAQVFVVSLQGAGTRGLQLSRISRDWRIGAVQKWWLEYDALLPRLRTMDYLERNDALWNLASRFPSCDAPPPVTPSAAAR